jgi:hypothetical protein
MIDRLINDPAFLPITIIFLVLSVYAVWQKLDRFILPLAIMYIVYAVFTGLTTADEDTSLKPVKIVEEQSIINMDTINLINLDEASEPAPLDTLLIIKAEPEPQAEEVKPDLPDLRVNSLLMCEFVIDSLRKPINSGDEFSVTLDRIYCYSGIRNALSDRTIIYEWYFEGNYINSIPIKIGRSVHWRSWTYKTINDAQIGKWFVVIKDELTQAEMDTIHFTIIDEKIEL